MQLAGGLPRPVERLRQRLRLPLVVLAAVAAGGTAGSGRSRPTTSAGPIVTS